jgi:hypothetical protein
MHGDVRSGIDATLMQKVDFTPTTYAILPGGSVGELESPVGDVMLPLLLMALVYTVVRFWRNRKLLLKSK